MNRGLGVDVTLDLVHIHVRVVLEVLGKAVVFLNDRIEDRGENFVRVLIAGVDTAVLILKLNSTSDGLSKGEAGSLGFDATQFFPFIRCHVLGNETFGGPDVGEGLYSTLKTRQKSSGVDIISQKFILRSN